MSGVRTKDKHWGETGAPIPSELVDTKLNRSKALANFDC